MKTKTARQCLDDPEFAAKALRKAMGLTLQDITVCVKRRSPHLIDTFLECFVEVEGLDLQKMMQMDYLDLLCLIANIKDNDAYEGMYNKDGDRLREVFASEEEYLYRIDLLRILLMLLDKDNPFVHVLLNVPFANLCRELQRRVHTEEFMQCCKRLVDKAGRAELTEDGFENETIGRILNTGHEMLSKRWIPAVFAPGAYAERIRRMLRAIGDLLIEPFRLAYPERFHIEDVRDKFGEDALTVCEGFAERASRRKE